MTSERARPVAVNAAVPGSATAEEHADMPAITVQKDQLSQSPTLLRDELGKNFLSAVSAVDYLGYGERGRRLLGQRARPRHQPHRQLGHARDRGAARTSASRSSTTSPRIGRNGGPPERVRMMVALDEGEAVPTVVSVWPTADWHEREQFDMMGIEFAGHPNLKRLIMPSDWAGHPLRKDYPIGGEPVQFTDAV